MEKKKKKKKKKRRKRWKDLFRDGGLEVYCTLGVKCCGTGEFVYISVDFIVVDRPTESRYQNSIAISAGASVLSISARSLPHGWLLYFYHARDATRLD